MYVKEFLHILQPKQHIVTECLLKQTLTNLEKCKTTQVFLLNFFWETTYFKMLTLTFMTLLLLFENNSLKVYQF